MQTARTRVVAAAKLFSSSLLFKNQLTNRPFYFQVNRFSKSHTPPCFSSLLHSNRGLGFCFAFNLSKTHQMLFFSSEPAPNSISLMGPDHFLLTELVSENDWSQELENELETKNPSLTHETVIYVLKKLEKKPKKAIDFFDWFSDRKGIKPSSSAYNLMLRILGRKELMKEFWVFAKEMRDQGYDIDRETYENLLSRFGKEKMASEGAALTKFFSLVAEKNATDASLGAAVELILGLDWNEEVITKLGEHKFPLSDVAVVKILREIRNYPSKGLCFFRWAGEQAGYKHNAVTYNAIAKVLGREDCIEQFWDMVKEMKGEGFEMDIDTYIKVSRRMQKRKMMKEAVELYEIMMGGPYKPSLQDCNLLLRNLSLTNNPDLGLVFRVVKIYEAAGNSLSKAIYDGIHRSLTSKGRFDEAEKIFNAMKDAGFAPDNITYSQVVFGLCKVRRLDEACKMLDEMEACGCTPDIKTWTILIKGHFQADEVDKALFCFTKMLEKNCDADADLLEILVNELCDKNRMDAAYTLLLQMIEKARLRPWQATYKLLIQKILGEGKLEEALKLLHLMKKHNFPPFADPFIRYISKSGTVVDAMEFLKTVTVKQFPSSSAYLHLFKSFFEEGRHSEAQDLLYKCPHHIRSHNDILNLFSSKKLQNAS